jgi:hypothetical protein
VRLPSRLVPLYEGAAGTSALGEAYYNFGVVGPFIYFAWVGALFGWLSVGQWLTVRRAARYHDEHFLFQHSGHWLRSRTNRGGLAYWQQA